MPDISVRLIRDSADATPTVVTRGSVSRPSDPRKPVGKQRPAPRLVKRGSVSRPRA